MAVYPDPTVPVKVSVCTGPTVHFIGNWEADWATVPWFLIPPQQPAQKRSNKGLIQGENAGNTPTSFGKKVGYFKSYQKNKSVTLKFQ